MSVEKAEGVVVALEVKREDHRSASTAIYIELAPERFKNI